MIEAPASTANTSATPSTSDTAKISGRLTRPVAKANSTTAIEAIRANSAPTMMDRRFSRSTYTPTCSAVTSHGRLSMTTTEAISAGERVSVVASSGSATRITASAVLVVPVNAISSHSLRRGWAGAGCSLVTSETVEDSSDTASPGWSR
jgi:hypothetical protein